MEVGYKQKWTSLERAARWWYGYFGIQYVLLLKLGKRGQSLSYRLYDTVNNPILRCGHLPAAVQQGHISGNGSPSIITFDNRRLLAIPADRVLPAGVNDTLMVDLRAVKNQVTDTIASFYC